MENNQLTITEGTISFWIKNNSIQFNDNKSTELATLNPQGGSIKIIKNDDNKLKIVFIVSDKGEWDIEYGVSALDSQKRHMVVFTWNLKDGEINLYLDGQSVGSRKI